MAYIDVDKFADKICNFQAIDEDAANKMIWLLRTFPIADVAPKSEVARLETENLILKQKRLNLFDRLEFVKMARAKGAIEVIEHLENEGLLNMTPQGIANLKKKYGVTDTNVGGKYTEVENGT